jgi:hypothetical protein
MKEYTLASSMEYLRKSFDVGSGRILLLQQLHSTTISSKSNGTAKASVNGNGIAQKILTTILS